MRVEKNLNTPGERLRRARMLAGITTRREFEIRHKISANTLQGWEQDKNPLSDKGARRVVDALKAEGLFCSVEWLTHGTGMPPRPYEMLNAGLSEPVRVDKTLTDMNLREEQSIYQETQLFKQLNPNSIVINITDDAMEPYLSTGDYVGGVQLYEANINKYLGSICILELENNLILTRYLHAGTKDGLYIASCTNHKTRANVPLNLYNIKVVSAAPILWHRKKISSLVEE